MFYSPINLCYCSKFTNTTHPTLQRSRNNRLEFIIRQQTLCRCRGCFHDALESLHTFLPGVPGPNHLT